MSIRDEFERWYAKPKYTARRKGDGYTDDLVNDAWIAWQAAAAHYEAERNALLACLAQKDAALRIFDRDLTYINCQVTNGINWDDVQSARKALSIHPDNCSKGK